MTTDVRHVRVVRVRIAVAVDPNGAWRARGGNNAPPEPPMDPVRQAGRARNALSGRGRQARIVWVEAEVPVPEAYDDAETIDGRVTNDND